MLRPESAFKRVSLSPSIGDGLPQMHRCIHVRGERLTEVERAFAMAKLCELKRQIRDHDDSPPGSPREQLSSVPNRVARGYEHKAYRSSHATYPEEFMRRLFRNVLLADR